MYYRITGKTTVRTKALHDRYGSIVRVAPNELSFIDPNAWKDIFGHRTAANKGNFPKNMGAMGQDFFVKPGEPAGIIRADDAAHATQRRLVSHAFSDKALKEQEPLLKFYVDLLSSKLHGIVESSQEPGGPTVNMEEWYNFTTFDIMADLTFGEPLHLLDRSEYTQWVRVLFNTLKLVTYLGVSKSDTYCITGCASYSRSIADSIMIGSQRDSRHHQGSGIHDTKISAREAETALATLKPASGQTPRNEN
jgi:cytochrome P450